MNKPKGHIKPLLSRWLRGETGWKEVSRLENLAREDEFLSEAIEGYRRLPEADHAGNIERLRARLAPEKRRPMVLFYRVAAAVVFLAVAGSVLWFSGRFDAADLAQNIENEAAPTEQAEEQDSGFQPAPKTAAESPEDLTATSRAESPNQPQEKAKSSSAGESLAEAEKNTDADNKPARSAAPKPAAENARRIAAEPAAQDAMVLDETADKIAIPETARAREAAPPPPPPAAKRDQSFADNIPGAGTAVAKPGQHIVEGTVTDADGYPLIGASVIIKDTKKGTMTDVDGNFSLSMDTADQKLQVNYIGYQTKELDLNGKAKLDIRLEEERASLSELTVTGYGVAGEKETGTKAEPKGGYARLERYLRRNVQLPDEIKKDTIAGRVVLKFIVEPNGKLSNFQVLRSLCPTCDQEAIRVLREGPPWEILGDPKPVEVIQAVPFKKE